VKTFTYKDDYICTENTRYINTVALNWSMRVQRIARFAREFLPATRSCCNSWNSTLSSNFTACIIFQSNTKCIPHQFERTLGRGRAPDQRVVTYSMAGLHGRVARDCNKIRLKSVWRTRPSIIVSGTSLIMNEISMAMQNNHGNVRPLICDIGEYAISLRFPRFD